MGKRKKKKEREQAPETASPNGKKSDSAFKRFLKRLAADPQLKEIGLYAAAGAYYLFMSLVPLVLLVLSVIPYTSVTQQQLMDVVLPYVPEAFGQLLYAITSDVYTHSFTTLSLSVLVVLWSASNFLSNMVRGVSAIVDGREESYLRRRVMGMIYTLALILIILVNLVMLLFGERLLALFQSVWPEAAELWALFLQLRSLLFFAVITLLNALLYRYASRTAKHFFRQLPGAAIASLAWLIFTRLYSWALEEFGLFSFYGSFASIIISLFWMYCTLFIVFAGAWINTQWHWKTKEEKKQARADKKARKKAARQAEKDARRAARATLQEAEQVTLREVERAILRRQEEAAMQEAEQTVLQEAEKTAEPVAENGENGEKC